eukprot:COSAG02_NODE_3305_length_6966_cov_3.711664_8_plen_39_part_00
MTPTTLLLVLFIPPSHGESRMGTSRQLPHILADRDYTY